MSKYLSRDDILSVNDIQIEELPVPEWGGVICVRSLRASERDELEAAVMIMGADGQPKGMRLEQIRAMTAYLGICSETGEHIFTKNDIEALGQKSAAALDRVVKRIQDLSAVSPKDIEVLVADLKNAQPAALPTA